MVIYIALLQGVNVGKHKRIAMADLKRIVIDAGGEHPATVANSGNVLFAYGGERDEEQVRASLENPSPITLACRCRRSYAPPLSCSR